MNRNLVGTVCFLYDFIEYLLCIVVVWVVVFIERRCGDGRSFVLIHIWYFCNVY